MQYECLCEKIKKEKDGKKEMVKKNYTSWLIMLLISAVLLSLTACGSKKGPKNAEEASAMHKDLMAQENAILSKKHSALG